MTPINRNLSITAPIVTVKHSGLNSAKIVNIDGGVVSLNNSRPVILQSFHNQGNQLYLKPLV